METFEVKTPHADMGTFKSKMIKLPVATKIFKIKTSLVVMEILTLLHSEPAKTP